jgi:hypothetical protein
MIAPYECLDIDATAHKEDAASLGARRQAKGG